jgi:hypothetical protein
VQRSEANQLMHYVYMQKPHNETSARGAWLLDVEIVSSTNNLYIKVSPFNTERNESKGPPAGNKARCKRTNTLQSKATQRKAKPNQTPQTHRRGARQA